MDTLKQWHQKLRFSFTGGMETQYLQYRSTTVVPIMLVLAVISTSLITAQIVLRFRSPPPRPAWALVLDFVGLAPSFVIVWIAPLRCCPPAIAEGSGRRVWLFYLATWSAFAVGLGRDTALLMLGHESMLFDGGDGILLKMVLMHNLQVLSFWDALATSLACSVLPLCVFFPNAILIQRLLVTVLVSAATGWLGETSTRRDFVLQQTLKGKEAESQFLARMSHEIRTPLLGICGFLELLQATPLSSVQQDYVSSMGTATTLLRSIVNDTLDHAKLRAGKMQVCREATRLADLLLECKAMFRAQLESKGLAMDHHIDPEVSGPVLLDPLRVRQMLNNLLSNAIKFTEAGKIQVTVLPTELKGKPGILVEVRDTGVGVPVDKQAALFEPFCQADESISRHHGGTGLGLPIVKEFAAVMGGDVGCCAEPGQGSTFWFSFQAEGAADGAETRDRIVDVACDERWRVMVVDDTALNLRLASHMLSHMACEGLLMDSGAAALDYLRTSHQSTFPDIVFMDFCMPEMDGFETTAAILALCPNMPIVGLTADASTEHHQKAMRCGMRHVLIKPFRERELAEACNQFGSRVEREAGAARVVAAAPSQPSRVPADRYSVQDFLVPTAAWSESH